MKTKTLLSYSLLAGLLSFSIPASAGFSFDSPFDWFDNNNDSDYYRYGDRGGHGNYGGERWRQYDEWEPNYWRYRFFDNNSNDSFFDGNSFGDGRGRFNFDMNMDMDTNSRFDGRGDGRYYGDGRYDGNRYDGRRYYDGAQGRNRAAPAPRDRRDYPQRDQRRAIDPYQGRSQGQGQSQNQGDQYNDDYWRQYSQRYNRQQGYNNRDPRR